MSGCATATRLFGRRLQEPVPGGLRHPVLLCCSGCVAAFPGGLGEQGVTGERGRLVTALQPVREACPHCPRDSCGKHRVLINNF